MRALLRGNESYFVILVCDAGFVMDVPNAPMEARDCINLDTICQQEHCVLLHTSNKHYKYH